MSSWAPSLAQSATPTQRNRRQKGRRLDQADLLRSTSFDTANNHQQTALNTCPAPAGI